jgi:hypothetical protein
MAPAEPTTPASGTNVPVGVGTIAGLGSGGSALALAVVAFISGDRSQETIGALASGTFLIAITVIGRMLQAKALATPNVVNVIERTSTARSEHHDPGAAVTALFDHEALDGPRHSEAVAEHDRDIEGAEYDTLVNPKDEERDIHEVA